MEKKIKLPKLADILLTLIGVALCGIGTGFANCAALGLDAIGILYDGVRNVLGLSSEALGIASFIVSAVIILFLFIVKRKYVSFGTLIYVVGYSACISVGNGIHHFVTGGREDLWIRIIFSVVGFMLLYVGLSIYVAVDIGVDAFTGLVLYLRDVTKMELKYVKIQFDLVLIVAGALMGGKLGVATLVTMIVAGPILQWLSTRFQAIYWRWRLKDQKEIAP